MLLTPRAGRRGPLSPRELAVLLATLLLAQGCAPTAPTAPTAASPRLPFAGQQLKVFNWSDYIDPGVVKEFERRTGARVQYDNYSTDAELETKILTGGGGYDVIFPSDRSLTPLRKKDQLAPIDKSLLPNLKYIDPKFMGARFDPENRFSVPYFWGTAAVGIRSDHVTGPVNGFDVLFDPKYKGRITMLDDPENVVAIVLLHLGLPMNSTEPADLAKVKEVLKKQRPLIQAYTSDGYKEKLISGEAWVALGWSGDILQARSKEEKVRVILPATGSMLWVDSIAIPKGVENVPLAHAFMNFLLDPEIAARNADFVQYATPNTAALSKIDPKLRDDPAIYPPPELLARCQWLNDRGPAIARIEELWQEVK